MRTGDQGAAGWMRIPERSNTLMLRAMSWVSLRLGRSVGRLFLYGAAAYFLLFAPASRRASRLYLKRALQRDPTWSDIYRHFLCFGSTIHDRIYLLNQRFDLFDISVHGEQLVKRSGAADEQSGEGLFLLGAHMGSFEVIRALGRRDSGLKVAMAMYEDNARKLNQTLSAINPTAVQDVIGLGKVDSMLQISAALEQGSMVGMLADRGLGGDATQTISLLGDPAQFPLGPFRMAAVLRRPIVFMVGLYMGRNRYEIHFEELADFSQVGPGGRQAELERAMTRYVALLEKYCRKAPYNWFNFFDFWQMPEKRVNT